MNVVPLEETVRLAVLAGEVLLRNGAETSRAEETMGHIARACGAGGVESFVIPTGVFITVSGKDGRSLTAIRRVSERTINLDRIAKVNALSRSLAEGRVAPTAALCQLAAIAKERTGFGVGSSMLASGGVGGSFAFLQSGGPGDVLAAFAAALAVRFFAHVVSRLNGVQFTFEFFGALAAALVGSLAHLFWPDLSRDIVIVGGIMPLVPGMAITNAIRDVIAGDLLSGMSRGLEAALTSAAVAMGVVIVLAANL